MNLTELDKTLTIAYGGTIGGGRILKAHVTNVTLKAFSVRGIHEKTGDVVEFWIPKKVVEGKLDRFENGSAQVVKLPTWFSPEI